MTWKEEYEREEAFNRKVSRVFDLQERHADALSAGNLASIVTTLKVGLGKLPSLMGIWEQHLESIQPEYRFIPFLNDGSFTIAAIADDSTLVAKLNELSAKYQPDFDISAFARDFEIRDKALNIIAGVGEIEQFALRREFDRGDWTRLSEIRYWLIRTGAVFSEQRDGKNWLLAAKPALSSNRKAVPPTLARDIKAATPALLDLTVIGEPDGPELLRGEEPVAQRFEPRTVNSEKSLLPNDARHSSRYQSLRLRDGVWLYRHESKADGTFDYAVEVLSVDGEKVGAAVLEVGGQLFHGPGADCVVTVDGVLTVKVYDQQGALARTFSLWANPDFRKAYEPVKRDRDRHVVLRSVAASIEHDLFAFTVLDCVFVYRLHREERLAAWRLPAVFHRHVEREVEMSEEVQALHARWDAEETPEERERREAFKEQIRATHRQPDIPAAIRGVGLPESASWRRIASYLDAHGHERVYTGLSVAMNFGVPNEATPAEELAIVGGTLWADWAYFVQVAEGGDAIWVGGHSGLLLRLGFDGHASGVWQLPSSPRVLVETPTETWALAGYFVAVVSGQSEPILYDLGKDYPEYVGRDVLVSRKGTSFKAVDVAHRSTGLFEVKQGIRVLYEAAGEVVVETATSAIRTTDLRA